MDIPEEIEERFAEIAQPDGTKSLIPAAPRFGDPLVTSSLRTAVRAAAKRPGCPHRRLAVEMEALGVAHFISIPWWQVPPPMGEKPEHAFNANRHERRRLHGERRRRANRRRKHRKEVQA